MYKVGGIDMKNPNALIAMAYVSQHADNPYAVFCEYIKYCMAVNSADTMTLAEIQTSVGKEFGLYLPYNIVLKCLEILSAQGIVRCDNHRVQRIDHFDVESFERRRFEYQQIETEIINDLIDYVKSYEKNWTNEYAREQLIRVLDRNGLAYDIFFHTKTPQRENMRVGENLPSAEDILIDEDENETEDENIDEQPLFSDSFYVGRFVEKVLAENTIKKEYLNRICEGLMLCVGAYQIPSENAEITAPKINGTTFFFDTRLLLRFIGCAGEAAVTATKELVQLIQSANGIVCYFPHTLEEMLVAFDKAIRSVENNYILRDDEMRIYLSTIRNNITILRAKKANLKSELEKSNIFIRQIDVYSDNDKLRYGFSLEDLQQYMCNSLNWERQAILNDALSIWEVHMQREGNYTEYCGTQSRLPVFVTSNSRLIGVALDYRYARPNTANISTWKSNRLPVITDIRLTCRLWSPTTQGNRLSMLYLAANSVAAQRPTRKYLNKIRDCVIELGKQIPEYSDICLPAFFDDNITDAIFENTRGSESNLNIGTFASIIAEFAEWKAKDQEEITSEVVNKLNEVSEQYNHQIDDIIEGAVQQCNSRFQKYNYLLWAIINWPVITAIAFTGVSAIISRATNNCTLMWSAFFVIAVAIIEKITASHFVTRIILRKILPYVISRYDKNADKFLRQVEMPYKGRILEKYCNENELFCRCKEICEDRE